VKTYTFSADDFLQAIIQLAKTEPLFQQYLDSLNRAATNIASFGRQQKQTRASRLVRRGKRRGRKARP